MGSLGNKEVMAKNIQKNMDRLGIDRNKLSAELDIRYTTLTDWLKAKTYPRIDKIELLANYFGITKADLVEENNESNIAYIYDQLEPNRQKKVYNYATKQLEEQKQEKNETSVNDLDRHKMKKANEIPEGYYVEVAALASAGDGCYAFEKEVPYSVWVENIPSDYDLAFQITGNSMEPTFRDKEVIFVKK